MKVIISNQADDDARDLIVTLENNRNIGLLVYRHETEHGMAIELNPLQVAELMAVLRFWQKGE